MVRESETLPLQLLSVNQTEENFEPISSDVVFEPSVTLPRNETNIKLKEYVPVAERKIVDLLPANMTLEE